MFPEQKHRNYIEKCSRNSYQHLQGFQIQWILHALKIQSICTTKRISN